MTDSIRAARRTISITNADRVLFPAAGVTKLGLARYYASVAPALVRHARGRPLATQSFPKGIDEHGFFLKNAARHFPDWIATARVPKREGGTLRQVLINEPATIVYLAGQNAITPHIWTARADRLEYPDRLIIDLDPSQQSFAEVRAIACAAGDLLREIGLEPFAMTTGSRGLHVVTPLRRTADYEAVNAFARELAAALVERDPDTLTAEFRRDKRGDRLFLDVARNAYGQHAVAPYAVRALPAAPVAMPLRWEELSDERLEAQRWTVANAAERLADEGDAWEHIQPAARSIGPARSRLRRLGRS